MGIWLGTATSLKHGGPASLLIASLLTASVLHCMTQSLGELAVMYHSTLHMFSECPYLLAPPRN